MDFKTFITGHGVSIAPEKHHHAHRGWVNIDCIYCGKNSGKFHLGYNERFRSFHCWRCGKHPFVETVHRLIPSLPISEIIALHKEGLSRDFQVVRNSDKKQPGVFRTPFTPGPLLLPHQKYLKKRRLFNQAVVAMWRIAGIQPTGDWGWRLFLPVVFEQRLVSWTTRTVIDDEPLRYRSASQEEEEIPHKELLYGEHLVNGPAIIIVEGPIDAITIGPGAVAVFGTSFSHAQVDRMAQYPKRIICFDNQKHAQQRARELAQRLALLPGETFNVVLSGKDANDSSPEEVRELRRML